MKRFEYKHLFFPSLEIIDLTDEIHRLENERIRIQEELGREQVEKDEKYKQLGEQVEKLRKRLKEKREMTLEGTLNSFAQEGWRVIALFKYTKRSYEYVLEREVTG